MLFMGIVRLWLTTTGRAMRSASTKWDNTSNWLLLFGKTIAQLLWSPATQILLSQQLYNGRQGMVQAVHGRGGTQAVLGHSDEGEYYKYIWWFLFDVAVTNAYILCKNHTNFTVPSVKDFRIDLTKTLIWEYCSRKRIGRPSAIPPAQRFCEDHFPWKGAEKPHCCYYCPPAQGKEEAWKCMVLQQLPTFLCHTGKDQEDCCIWS